MHITQVIGGEHLRLRTCARAGVPYYRISETVRRIALKFGVWFETH